MKQEMRPSGYGDSIYDIDYSCDILRASRGMAFRRKEQAELAADAVFVLFQLRNQPNAGKCIEKEHEVDGGWTLVYHKDLNKFTYSKAVHSPNYICPAFPTEKDCRAAVEAVGEERVKNAIKVFAMVGIEV